MDKTLTLLLRCDTQILACRGGHGPRLHRIHRGRRKAQGSIGQDLLTCSILDIDLPGHGVNIWVFVI